jgi:hypothetical protein
MSHAEEPIRTHCQNCETELKGPYCHKCGQHDFDAHASFGHALHEVLESFFHWDGKFFGGIYDLLFRPGYLTAEYNAGRRARHIPPLRLYIFVSVLFFLCPSPESSGGAASVDVAGGKEQLVKELEVKQHEKADPGEKELLQRAEHIAENSDELMEKFHHYLPRAMLACLPFFALLSMLVFRKSGYSFLQHLVLALNLHSFFFLFTLSVSGWRQVIGHWSGVLSGWLYFLSAVYLVIYAYLTLRRVFKRGSGKRVAFKGVLLLGCYGVVVGMVMLATIIIAALVV